MNKKQLLKYTPTLFAVLLLAVALPSVLSESEYGYQGTFTLIHADSEGNILSIHTQTNLVNNEGMECIGDLLFNGTAVCTSEAVFQYLAVGLTNTAPADGDTALASESGGCARVQDATPDINTGSTGIRTVTLTSVFSGGSCESETYVETGIFDASSSGNMLARAIFTGITLSSGDTLTINYSIVLNNA